MAYFIIIRGPLGIGKSTIAKKLAKKLRGEYISIDEILHKNNLTKDKEKEYVSQKSFLKSNELSIPKAKVALIKGKIVIFDGNFYWKSQINDLIKKLGYPNYVFTLKASLSVCIERDSKRKKGYGKGAAEAVYKKAVGIRKGKIIDTENKTVNEVVKEIISCLP